MNGEPHNPKIANLFAYVVDRTAHNNAGFIGGKYYLNGKYYSESEFKQMFPAKIEYTGETESEGQMGR